jgi:predicted ribosome quality control (RQC) complex YloA/Tae2 family protein
MKQRDLVRSLAVDLGLGRLYANEACAALSLGRDMELAKLSDGDLERILSWLVELKTIIEGENDAVVYGGEEPDEFSPFKLHIQESEPLSVESFNQAADQVYAREEGDEIQSEATSEHDDKRNRLTKRLEIQRTQAEGLMGKAEESRVLGDLIYSNFPLVSNIIGRVAGETKVSEKGIIEILAKLGISEDFEGYDPEKRVLKLRIGDHVLPISLRSSPGENAATFYDRAKDLERRAEGARLAMIKTKSEIVKSSRQQVEKPPRPEMRSRQPDWYEKFRWFFSSEGNLVISGRDARSNETLFRRHLEQKDIYAHADVHGAPSTIIKAGEGDIGAETKREACIQALLHSSTWKAGTTAGDVYWVSSDQVTKSPNAGEFLARGAFVIRGKRNYLRGLEARCGICWIDNRFMCGPLEAIQNHCDMFLEIVPGSRKKSDIAKEVIRRLASDENTDIDQLIQVLPAGKLEIKG